MTRYRTNIHLDFTKTKTRGTEIFQRIIKEAINDQDFLQSTSRLVRFYGIQSGRNNRYIKKFVKKLGFILD
jgi:hypothetical protein